MNEKKPAGKRIRLLPLLLGICFCLTGCIDLLLDDTDELEEYPEYAYGEYCDDEYCYDGYGYDEYCSDDYCYDGYDSGEYCYDGYDSGDYCYDGYDSGDYCYDSNGYDDYYGSQEYGYGGMGSFGQYGYDDFNGYDDSEVFGSSGRLEGTIAVVTLLVDDATCTWDLNGSKDQKTYASLRKDIKIACEYLEKSCADYGRSVKFIWDWDENKELKYDMSISVQAQQQPERTYDEVRSFIRSDIDSEGIKKKLGANGIIYLACVDTPSSNSVTSATYMWERDYPIKEEICIMAMYCDGLAEAPSCFAHEMLHTFGAPDLYTPGGFGITQEDVRYMESIKLNDIMRTNDDPKTGYYLYDRIPNEITDITAYYVGLTDHSKMVESFGLEESDYEAVGNN